MEISAGMSFLVILFGLLIDVLGIYFGYKLLKWIYHKFVPVKEQPDPNLFYTTTGKPLRRAPWNGKLYEDMDEYEHDRQIAEGAYSDGYSDGYSQGNIR